MSLSIGQAATHTGCPASTIRYYEEIGLVPAATRGDNGYRYYDAAAVSRLAFAHRARVLGFSLEAVASLLRLADHPSAPCNDVDALVADKIAEVRARQADLARLETSLVRLEDCCHGDHAIADCGILAALSGSPKSVAADT
ncbi:MerR family DNA-binding protein [Salinisphaera japonica]|uniref:MerR family transcriptional regulator n=1 Tax=Salinisphaera japonica YTM-1 TaxID=1209778 RepID=A0A423PZL6_9GAMM|nr:MerR family DNA-binding protein [Salinisphaera japonica]ROO31150.1 MerR family transcriptional regulator [Salinisphaera japonica YTM-1]